MTHRAVFMGLERSSSTEAAADFDRLMVLVRMFAPDLVGGRQVPLAPGDFEKVADAMQRVRDEQALRDALERAGPKPEPVFKFVGKERA